MASEYQYGRLITTTESGHGAQSTSADWGPHNLESPVNGGSPVVAGNGHGLLTGQPTALTESFTNQFAGSAAIHTVPAPVAEPASDALSQLQAHSPIHIEFSSNSGAIGVAPVSVPDPVPHLNVMLPTPEMPHADAPPNAPVLSAVHSGPGTTLDLAAQHQPAATIPTTPADNHVIIADANVDHGVIARMYDAAFGHAGDAGGLKYWLNEYDSAHVDLRGIAESLVNSPEFQHVAGTMNDAQFVQHIHEAMLGPQADHGAVVQHVEALQSGTVTREDLTVHVAKTAEADEAHEVIKIIHPEH